METQAKISGEWSGKGYGEIDPGSRWGSNLAEVAQDQGAAPIAAIGPRCEEAPECRYWDSGPGAAERNYDLTS